MNRPRVHESFSSVMFVQCVLKSAFKGNPAILNTNFIYFFYLKGFNSVLTYFSIYLNSGKISVFLIQNYKYPAQTSHADCLHLHQKETRSLLPAVDSGLISSLQWQLQVARMLAFNPVNQNFKIFTFSLSHFKTHNFFLQFHQHSRVRACFVAE